MEESPDEILDDEELFWKIFEKIFGGIPREMSGRILKSFLDEIFGRFLNNSVKNALNGVVQ